MRVWLVWLLAAASAGAQQTGEERLRGMWNEEFQAKRQESETPRPKPAKKTIPAKKGPLPTTVKPGDVVVAGPGSGVSDALVGITLWIGDGEQWSRISADAPLRAGQKVRVSIESARTGYLYVIDREQYADGTYGDPYLIFPTLRLHGGENDVVAGRVIEIPAWEDNPRWLTMTRNRTDHVAEVLTVLVTPSKLGELKIERAQLKLTREQVAEWEQKWGSKVTRLEAKGGEGKRYTAAEREAGERKRLLTHEEPLPQTMYHCDIVEGQPMLISVPLKLQK